MSKLTDRLERDLREIAAGAHPSPSARESIVARLDDAGESGFELVLAPSPSRSKRRAWITAAAAAFVVIAGAIAVLSRAGDDHSTAPVDQSPTTTFVSPRHGYSVQYPDGAVVTPATNFFWDPRIAEDVRQGQRPTVNDGVDVVETASGAVFTGGSMEDPGGFPMTRGPRSMITSTSTSWMAAAVRLAASRQRSPSTGSRAGSRSVRTRSWQPSSPAGGSMASPCCTVAVTPEPTSTPSPTRSA